MEPNDEPLDSMNSGDLNDPPPDEKEPRTNFDPTAGGNSIDNTDSLLYGTSALVDGTSAVAQGVGELASGAGELVSGAASAAGELLGSGAEAAGSAIEGFGGCIEGCGSCSLTLLVALFMMAGTALAVLR
jgi:X-X-X-Leu-X-X-Gly heptad repeat protein